MKPDKKSVLLLSITLRTLLFVRDASAHVIYHSKEDMIQKYKDLCYAHQDVASWEVIGHSVQRREIILVRIGNQMVDGC